MFLHYLKIAWRNLLKYKTQTIISVLGLTIGVVFFAYGYYWYQYETSYDSFYPDSDRIYRVYGIEKSTLRHQASIPYVAVKAIEKDFPEIEKRAVVYNKISISFTYDDQTIDDPEVIYVDEDFFKMFPPHVICGSLDDDLFAKKEIHDMVVTEKFARQFFETPENALGKQLTAPSYSASYIIKAVIKDQPSNSIFQATCYLADFEVRQIAAESEEKIQWNYFYQAQLYIQFGEHVNRKTFEEKLRDYAIDNDYNTNLLFALSPLRMIKHDINEGWAFAKQTGFDLLYIRVFLLAGILLLLSVFFNWLTILINSIVQRYREVNLRKVSGAGTSTFLVQLFVEIGLLLLFVVVLSFCVAELTASSFERLFHTVIVRQQFNKILLVAFILITVFLYAVLVISLRRFLQKASFRKNVNKSHIQRTLSTGRISLVIQLIVGAFFIMSAYVFWQQIRFMQKADWGISKDHVIQVGIVGPDKNTILNEIKQLSSVVEVCATGLFTISNEAGPFSQSNVQWEGRPGDFHPFFQVVDVGYNFVSFFDLDILSGRDFTEADLSSDIGKALINEEALRVMQLDNPIGRKIEFDADYYTPEGPGRDRLEIIGIIKDFHGIGLKKSIMPMILKSVIPWRETIYYIKVIPGTETETLDLIGTILDKNRDEVPVSMSSDRTLIMMNELLNDLSKPEQELLKLFTVVALLCILIAIFGIYSVSQRETQRRQKEIAIRKAVGAKAKEIMGMFFREYFIITLIACVIALPIAWLFMQRWLESFAYHINISWWMFAVVIAVVVFIVSVTIVSQVVRAAGRNPAEVVKSE